jgi:nucleotide-binding universal stress UspA family protein
LVSIRQAFRGHAPSTPVEQLSIIVPITGDESDERLLTVVERIARRQAAQVTLVYVVEVMQSMPLDAELPVQCDRGEIVLQKCRDQIVRNLESKVSSVSTEILQARAAGPAIVDEAIIRNADAIMMSAKLTRKFGKLTVGETTEYVLRNAHCEVIVIRQAMPDWLLASLEVDIE